MDTPKNVRPLKSDEIVHRGDYIRQGDCCFEYTMETGYHAGSGFYFRKVSRRGQILAWLDSLFGREGLTYQGRKI